MIISTHLISDIEPIINTAVFMSAGQVFLTGDADELRQKYQTSLDGLFRGMYRWLQNLLNTILMRWKNQSV